MIRVGRVGRPHGLQGAFVVEDASEDPDRFAVGARLYVGGEPSEIVESKRAGGRIVIRLDRRVVRGDELALREEDLPEPEEGAWYAYRLIGAEVVEEGGRVLGRVVEVAPGVANDVLELDTGRLLPFVDACVCDVDVERGRIVVAAGFADPTD